MTKKNWWFRNSIGIAKISPAEIIGTIAILGAIFWIISLIA